MIHLCELRVHNFKQLSDVHLEFPRRGRFLIQGLNEAGKSTLFEAVFFALFGRALASETAQGRLDDLVHYGAEEAYVALTLQLRGGREMRIRRRVRRAKNNVWEMDLADPEGQVEEVRGNAVVNERIEAELGLDADALLNTCFVEQKKLDKLEGMNRSQREQSLMKLLNLDRLIEIEAQLKVKPADQAQVERLRSRAALAALQAELPSLSERFRAVGAVLARLEARRMAEQAIESAGEIERLDAATRDAEAKEAALAVRASDAERYRLGLLRLQEGRAHRDRARSAAADGARLAADLERARRAREEDLPAVVYRGQALRRLKRRIEWVDGVGRCQDKLASDVVAADQRLAELAKGREALNALRQALVAARGAARDAENDLAEIQNDVRAFDVREATRGWLAAQAALAGRTDPQERLTALRAGIVAVRRRGRLQLAALISAAAAGLLLATGLANAPRVLALAFAGLAGLAFLVRALGVFRQEAELNTRIGRLEGEAAVSARETAALAERETVAAERFRELNAVRPATPERARETLAELDAALGSRTRDDVHGAHQAARDALAHSRASVAALEPQEAALRETTGRIDGMALGQERDRQAEQVQRMAAILDRRRPKLTALADTLATPADAIAVEGELGALRHQVAPLRELVARIGTQETEHAAQSAAAKDQWAKAAQVWAELPEVGDPPEQRWPDWSTDLADADWDAATGTLAAAFEAAGGEAIRRALEAAARTAAGLRERLAHSRRTHDGVVAELRRLGAQMTPRLALPSQPDQADLEALLSGPLASAPGEDPAALRVEFEALRDRSIAVRHDIERLARELGLQGETLDVAEAEAAHAAAAHALQVRAKGASLVAQAARNVVQGILPSTLEHMHRLLPLLTGDRYMDAQLSDDYRIQVWDDRAQAWKLKNIFSGGTRDQFSLALRLAFALATLPEERGTAPSFLFLDEPLGAFDTERAGALIRLLTEGEIATSFDQTFLISHIPVDAELFDHRILLAEGRVAESTLAETTLEVSGEAA